MQGCASMWGNFGIWNFPVLCLVNAHFHSHMESLQRVNQNMTVLLNSFDIFWPTVNSPEFYIHIMKTFFFFCTIFALKIKRLVELHSWKWPKKISLNWPLPGLFVKSTSLSVTKLNFILTCFTYSIYVI